MKPTTPTSSGLYPTFLSPLATRKTWTQCPATAISLKSQHWGKKWHVKIPYSVCLFWKNPLFAHHNQWTSLWTAFVKFLLWEGNSSQWLLTGTSVSSPEKDTSLLSFSKCHFLILWASATSFQSHSLHQGDSWRVGGSCLQTKSNSTAPHCLYLWWTGSLRLHNCNVN